MQAAAHSSRLGGFSLGVGVVVVLTLATLLFVQPSDSEAATWSRTYRGTCQASTENVWYSSSTAYPVIGGYVQSCHYTGPGLVLYGRTVGNASFTTSGWALSYGHSEVTARSSCKYNILNHGISSPLTCRSTHNR